MRADADVRRLRIADAAAYRALMLDGYRTHPEAFTATVDERAALPLAWWETRVEREFVVGAWYSDRLIGVAGLVEESRLRTLHKATLYGMYVDADHARRGVGARLVHAILDQATTRKTLRVVQLTVTENNRAAHALYGRCGFVAFGTEPYAIAVDDGYRAKVHMRIDLATRVAPNRLASTREASHA